LIVRPKANARKKNFLRDFVFPFRQIFRQSITMFLLLTATIQ